MSHLRMSAADFQARQTKKPKYGNRKKMVNGIEFASTREATRYQDLELMQQAGQITALRRQVCYSIEVNGVHVCDYIADFVFDRDGKTVVADAKGFREKTYLLKRKLMKAAHGIDIEEM